MVVLCYWMTFLNIYCDVCMKKSDRLRADHDSDHDQTELSIHVNLLAGAFFSRFWGSHPSLPSTFKIFHPWKKSSTIKSWPTFCDQYFWKFPIWNSCADEKRREIWMVKVNVIFNDIRLLICLTPLQVNWVMVIN